MGNSNTASTPVVKLRRPATLDHLRRKQRPWQVLEVCLDMNAKKALDDAEKALAKTEREMPKDATAAERERRLNPLRDAVQEAKDAVAKASEELLFESIGRAKREALIAQHPPTEEDEEAAEEAYKLAKAQAERPELVAKQRPQFNLKTYSLALVAASCSVPRLSEAEWEELVADWTDGEFTALWITAQMVNQDGSLVSLGKGSLNASNGTSASCGAGVLRPVRD
jgi:hypothetical protein